LAAAVIAVSAYTASAACRAYTVVTPRSSMVAAASPTAAYTACCRVLAAVA